MAMQDSNYYNGNIPDYLQKSFAAQMIRYAPNGTAPLFGLASMLGDSVAKAVEHGYFAKTMVFPGVTLNGAVLAAATTLVVDSTATVLAGDLLRVQSSGEIIRITAVVSATDLTVVRGFGQIAAANIADNANLYGIGNAFEQGSNRPASRLMNPVRVLNYTHIFRNSWSLPTTVSVIAPIVGDSLVAEGKMDCGMFHSSDIERATIFSQRSGAIVNGQYLTTMDGIIETVRRLAPVANTNTAGATTNYTQLEGFLNPGFNTINNGRDGNLRTAFVGGTARTVINNIGRLSGQYQIVDGQTNFGLQFQTFKTSRGSFKMIEHPQFNSNDDWSKLCVSVDLGSMKYAYLRKTSNVEYGMDGKAVESGQDAVGGTLTTEVTLEIVNPSAHTVVHGLTAAA
jgi:hypothetical protein